MNSHEVPLAPTRCRTLVARPAAMPAIQDGPGLPIHHPRTGALPPCAGVGGKRQPPRSRSVDSMAQKHVTAILRAWRQGDREATEQLMSLVYDELRAMAAGYLRGERANHTLEPTALVHEAYLRLVDQRDVDWQERAHFFGVAAAIMRRILLDHARRRLALKRGEGRALPIISSRELAVERPPELIALDEALTRLAEFDPEKAKLVELKFFTGLTVAETASALGCSTATVTRQWRTARAWLFHQLSAGATDAG